MDVKFTKGGEKCIVAFRFLLGSWTVLVLCIHPSMNGKPFALSTSFLKMTKYERLGVIL